MSDLGSVYCFVTYDTLDGERISRYETVGIDEQAAARAAYDAFRWKVAVRGIETFASPPRHWQPSLEAKEMIV